RCFKRLGARHLPNIVGRRLIFGLGLAVFPKTTVACVGKNSTDGVVSPHSVLGFWWYWSVRIVIQQTGNLIHGPMIVYVPVKDTSDEFGIFHIDYDLASRSPSARKGARNRLTAITERQGADD